MFAFVKFVGEDLAMIRNTTWLLLALVVALVGALAPVRAEMDDKTLDKEFRAKYDAAMQRDDYQRRGPAVDRPRRSDDCGRRG